jgi:hypothetical protein
MHRQLGVLLLALLLPLAACSGDDGTEPTEDGVEGTYALLTVNGNTLPFLLQETTAQKVELISGSIVLRANGTFDDVLNYRITPTGGAAAAEVDLITGTFLKSASILMFSPSEGQGGGYEVSIVTGGLSTRINTFTLIYQK